MTTRRERPRRASTLLLLVVVACLARAPRGVDAETGIPRVRLAPSSGSSSSSSSSSASCRVAVENGREVADSAGATCAPTALAPDTGCCAAAIARASDETCADACSAKRCCDSYARCVVCCDLRAAKRASSALQTSSGGGDGGESREEEDDEEVAPVSPMHPTMWRKWLLTHDVRAETEDRADGGEIRGETFSDGGGERDAHVVSSFEYCAHRCRTNSAVTKYENEFQDAKHHCFGSVYAESVGADDTLSPGREKLHDQNGDFRIVNGEERTLKD
jgi:hypothetical protein